MNSRILVSLTMIAVASAGVGYGTYAYFTDTEQAVNNVFSAAKLDLLLDGASAPITARFGASDFAPGESDSGSIALSIVETISGPVDLDVKVTQTNAFDDTGNPGDPDDGGPSSPGLASWLLVDAFGYDAVDLKSMANAASDGRPGVSLQDLINRGTFADNAMPAAFPSTSTLTLTVTFDPDAPNHLKRDSVEFAVTFFAAQQAAADLA